MKVASINDLKRELGNLPQDTLVEICVRLAKFKKKNAEKAKRALDKLADAVERSENCFSMLLEAAEVCSLGQITGRLQEVVGRFRPMV